MVKGERLRVMIDSGAAENFMSERILRQLRIQDHEKEKTYELIVIDGSELPSQGRVNRETTPVRLQIGAHQEQITFDIVRMATHNIVLGRPWLVKHNPRINWKTDQIEFDGCDCVIASRKPTHRQRSVVDERKDFNQVEATASTSNKDRRLSRVSGSADTGEGQPDQEARVTGGKHTPSSVPQEYKKWAKLFEEEVSADALPTHQPWDHEIKLEPGKKPTFGPIYALSEKELQTLRQYLDENLKKGFIQKSESPAGYPILFVPKKDGGLRLCVDYRKLNDITVKNRYPLPNIKELQDRLQGAQWFTKLDLRGAYNLIRMKKGEEWKTAFRTRYGHYEYKVMPFGLTNAPATCQMMINDTLRAHLDHFAIAYLDDILIYSRTESQHIKHVKKILDCLQERRLQLKPEKCEFHKKEVDFLGFLVGVEGIRMDPSKIQSIKEWPQPRNVKDVQGFLGFANYNRQFIESYSKKALPLTNLTKKDTPFIWGKPQEQAFDSLRDACMSNPVLKLFDPTKPIRIETDASDLAVGACLSQEYDKKWHPVAYYSRKLSPAEQNYDIHDKELLAIVAALQQWRVYAEGAPGLDILTDHKNLLHFTTTKQLNRRQVRWSELLGQYKFTIRYTPGKENGRADALSRRSDLMDKEETRKSILKINEDGSISGNTQQLNATIAVLEDDDEQFPVVKGKLHIPQGKIKDCIRRYHDSPLKGHPGVTETLRTIRRSCHFKDMREHVTEYIKKCTMCQKNKHTTHKKYGELQFRPPPVQPWMEITMDFITKLPVSTDPLTEID